MSLTFTKRDSAFEDLEDVHDGEMYLGWIAPAKHGRKGRDWWLASAIGEHLKTVTGREAAVKLLTSTERARKARTA